MNESLRKCSVCGLEAWSEEDLNLFMRDKKMLHGRQNKCKECRNKNSRKGGKYYEKQLITSLAWKHRNKERLHLYDKKRYGTHPTLAKSHRDRRVLFNGKTIYLEENPRTNKCSFCGKSFPKELTQQTTLHHWAYEDDNPLTYSLELGTSCHKKLPKTVWVECGCGLKYDGWLYKQCPLCQTRNPVFSEATHREYINKIKKLRTASIH